MIVLAAQMKRSPYVNVDVTNLANASLLILICSIAFLQIMYTQQSEVGIFLFSFVTLIVLNYVFVLLVLRRFLQDLYECTIKPLLVESLSKDEEGLEYRLVSGFLRRFRSQTYEDLRRGVVNKSKNTNSLWYIIMKTFRKYVKLRRGVIRAQ